MTSKNDVRYWCVPQILVNAVSMFWPFSLQNEKALFSKVGRSDTDCFSICFYDSQRLERIRHKLQKSIKILQDAFDVAEGCKEYICLLEETIELDTTRASIAEIAHLQRRIKCHIRTATLLLEQTGGALKTARTLNLLRTEVPHTNISNSCFKFSHTVTMNPWSRARWRCSRTARSSLK